MKQLNNAKIVIRSGVREIKKDGCSNPFFYTDDVPLGKKLATEYYGGPVKHSTIEYETITIEHEDLGKLTFIKSDQIKFVSDEMDWKDILIKEKVKSIRSKLNSEEIMYLLQGGTI